MKGKNMETINLSHLSMDKQEVYLNDGTIVPIVHWVKNGEVVPNDERYEADACVAGPLPNGRWAAIDMREWSPVEMN